MRIHFFPEQKKSHGWGHRRRMGEWHREDTERGSSSNPGKGEGETWPPFAHRRIRFQFLAFLSLVQAPDAVTRCVTPGQLLGLSEL